MNSLLFEHCLYGSPSNPGGQEQVALWFLAEHIAVSLQGLSAIHGLIQLLLWQAWLGEHSESDEQPIGSGSTNIKYTNISFKARYILTN